MKKAVLAYSGGLDTSIIIPWLKENYGCEVIAVAGDVGQGGIELDGLIEKAVKTGASKCYVEDLRSEFVNDFIFPTLKAGAKYEGCYLLGTAFARPVIAKRIVEIAKAEGADAIVHGCTGKGNDQVRFELTIKAFAPEMKIIAPWRIWDLKSREDEIAYAEARNIPLQIKRETNYSKDRNLWHLSHEGLDLEDPANAPMYGKILELGVSPEKAPDAPECITIGFEKGIPVSLNGKGMDGVALAKELRNDGFTGAIVFLSASNDYGSESYSVRAFHYLLKPPSRESIKALLDMLARERDNADTAAIRLKSSGVVRSIRLRDVAYVEVIQHKVYFRLRQGGEIVVNSALKEYADELLRDARFVQCHRSYIVNMDEIKNSRNMEW